MLSISEDGMMRQELHKSPYQTNHDPCLQLQPLEECKGSGMVSGKKMANTKEQRKTVEMKY
jgi:hypothetical protein